MKVAEFGRGEGIIYVAIVFRERHLEQCHVAVYADDVGAGALRMAWRDQVVIAKAHPTIVPLRISVQRRDRWLGDRVDGTRDDVPARLSPGTGHEIILRVIRRPTVVPARSTVRVRGP